MQLYWISTSKTRFIDESSVKWAKLFNTNVSATQSHVVFICYGLKIPNSVIVILDRHRSNIKGLHFYYKVHSYKIRQSKT